MEGQDHEAPRTYEKIEEEPVKHGGKVNKRHPELDPSEGSQLSASLRSQKDPVE